STDDAIISLSLGGVITSWNRGAEKTYGYAAAEAVGRDLSFLTPPTEKQHIEEALSRVQRGQHADRLDTRRLRKDGELIDVALTVSPIQEPGGKIVGISSVARDVTERKRSEEALRQANAYNRSLLEASLDPLVTIAPDGKITDVNHAAEVVTGVARGELIGTDFSDYFTDPEKARAGYMQVFREGWVQDYELQVRHGEGHTTPVVYNASVYRDEAGSV